MAEHGIAIFPLHTVLFPGGILPLRIFEPRYLDMVSECLRAGVPFGVCLIKSGSEVERAAETVEVGTLARIVDWHPREDGSLGVIARGGQRFRILASTVESNQLRRADLELIPHEPAVALPARYGALAEALGQVLRELGEPFAAFATDEGGEGEEATWADATWVGFRLAELLPLPLAQKQQLLQLDDVLERLQRLEALFPSLERPGTPH